MNPFMNRKVVFFVTGNVHKFKEASHLLANYKISTAMLDLEAIEIQDDSLKNIAAASVVDASKKCNLPVFVEDAGLFVRSLNGFPGPYSSYVFRTLGIEGILKLMENKRKRDAYFLSVIAFYDNNQNKSEPQIFQGRVDGAITHRERGVLGFGFDPIFEPFEGNGMTFAEMTSEEKNVHSHRADALRKYADWYNHTILRRF